MSHIRYCWISHSSRNKLDHLNVSWPLQGTARVRPASTWEFLEYRLGLRWNFRKFYKSKPGLPNFLYSSFSHHRCLQKQVTNSRDWSHKPYRITDFVNLLLRSLRLSPTHTQNCATRIYRQSYAIIHRQVDNK